MASLSFKEGKALGIIKGGKHHNKILYIKTDDEIYKRKKTKKEDNDEESNEGNEGNGLPYDRMAFLDKEFFNNVKGRMKLIEFEKLKRAIKKQIEPLDPKLNDMYHKANVLLEDKVDKELELYDGEIYPLPNFVNEDRKSTR